MASEAPLLQEEEEAPRDGGLSVDSPCQATQVPEGTHRGGQVRVHSATPQLWGTDRIPSEPGASLNPVVTGTASKWGLVAERLLDLASGFSEVLSRVQLFVRRLLELHIFKLVALYTVWVALKEVSVQPWLLPSAWPARPGWGCSQPSLADAQALQVSVMNLLLVVLWAFALPYPRFRPMASCLSTVWSCIIIVCKMLYQLKVVNPQEYSSNCSEVLGPSWRGRLPPDRQAPLLSPIGPSLGMQVMV